MEKNKMSEIDKFEISDSNVLKRYKGNDSIVVVPNRVKEIERCVFYNCDLLEEISIPDGIEIIDETNFIECKNLKFNEADGVRYLGNKNNPYLVLVSAEKNIKEHDIKEGCKLIKGNAFDRCSELVRISIPSTVRQIGYMAFYNCYSLSEVKISEGVEKIYSCAFENCSIENLQLPNSLKYIGENAFSMVSLKEVSISNETLYIGCGAFAYNDIRYNEYKEGCYFGSDKNPYLCFVKPKDKNTSNIDIHSNCKIIYSNAFSKCKNLKNIKLPDGLVQIGKNAFQECYELEAINIPSNVTLIDECAFASCKRLKSIKIPNQRITIESGAFMECSSIETLELINAIVSDNVFDGCNGLKRLVVGEASNLYGYYIFSGCNSLKEAILPKKLENSTIIDELNEIGNVKITYV